VGVLETFTVCAVFAFDKGIWRWVWWWGLISVGGTNVVCVVLGHVTGGGEGLRRVSLGMFVWGVLWVGVYSSCVVVAVVSWCGIFGRLGSRVNLWLAVGFRFPEGVLSRVVSLSVSMVWIGLGRCRLWMYFFAADVSDPCLYVGCVVVVGAFG